MEKELKQLAEEYGWLGLEPPENLRVAMWQIGECMALGASEGKSLDVAAALYCVVTGNGEKPMIPIRVEGHTLEYVMYKTALAALDVQRVRNPIAHAYQALAACLGLVSDPKKALAKHLKAVAAAMTEKKDARADAPAE